MSRKYTAQEMRDAANRFAFEEDSSRSDTIVAMLRQAADMIEREDKRERKYEYACFNRVFQTLNGARMYAISNEVQWRRPTIVRRAVGEWEEVSNV